MTKTLSTICSDMKARAALMQDRYRHLSDENRLIADATMLFTGVTAGCCAAWELIGVFF